MRVNTQNCIFFLKKVQRLQRKNSETFLHDRDKKKLNYLGLSGVKTVL